ncbi:MAG: FAD-dependent tricarballylate dehydrogenase TcuA [Sphingobium sp.]|jgi:tricarballylate dehydrogenase|nr:FAD-dependent tricarballylate dehydrogenase TcuA [Sphingobium sp.]MCI1270225.1 FAD-dependent tricarballylate dehydrogenase TcuA [Sphingobium sp.]MCI1757270.1 FAD-dependent tricarballylate dehydrogenase TcuA [Sphingobium sp.]MCI2053321.1 FAD-dependent tricarballylate dehydrogenase TcuA [Sphingobium sp.]
MMSNVLVVGAGNAALCAAISAAERGARVSVLERAPREARGGNSAFTGGCFRTVYNGVDDIQQLVPDLTEAERDSSDFGTYDAAKFYLDLCELSGYRADPILIDILVEQSLPTLLWMRDHGVRFLPSYGRQSFKVDGRNIFWGGLTVETAGGGLGLVDSLFRRAEALGVAIHYDSKVDQLLGDRHQVTGVVANGAELEADAVILAAGGFHANTEWRVRYLGPGWDLAKVRGSRYNTGNVIQAALNLGARSHGNWSGCHSVFFDAGADDFGNIAILNQQKNYFTLGIVVNRDGRRFFDEGSDFRNYTYSKMGAAILSQPGGTGWQVFDAQGAALLPDEYRVPRAARFEADTLEGLAAKMEGISRAQFLSTVAEFNRSINADVPFNPAIKDGRGTQGLAIAKSNWARTISEPPFVAYQVNCGITLTYGGLAIDADARVQNEEGEAIRGLYAAGELVGGLYYDRYPGGAGLTSGSVFGRIAGANAASC